MEMKSFFDVFKRYKPNAEIHAMLSRATRATLTKFDRESMIVEVDLYFSTHEDPFLLYLAEDECRELYGAQVFRILPHFPSEAFRIDFFQEIITEASMCGAFTKGFFKICVKYVTPVVMVFVLVALVLSYINV